MAEENKSNLRTAAITLVICTILSFAVPEAGKWILAVFTIFCIYWGWIE